MMSIRPYARARHFLLIVVLAVTGACDRQSASPPAPPPPATVTVASPIERKVVEWAYYTGRTQAAHTVELRARVSGYLERVAFEAGKIVQQGDLLFVIDQRPYRAALAQAEAELKHAQIEQIGRAHV